MTSLRTMWLGLAGVATGVLVTALAVAGGGRVALVAAVIYAAGITVVTVYAKFSRRAAVEREARRLGLSFSPRDPFGVLRLDFHPFLRFGRLPGTQAVENVAWGTRDGREVRAFEYRRPAEDEPIRYSCAMVRIPEAWPSLLVRRQGPFDAVRDAAGLRGQAFELEAFNRLFEVRAADRGWASAVIDQRMMGWLLGSDPAIGFQLQHGWLLVWMPRLPPEDLGRVLASAEGFQERIPRAVWSRYGDGAPARPDLD